MSETRSNARRFTSEDYKNPQSLAYRFRRKRFSIISNMINDTIKEKGECKIIDLGGTEYYWDMIGDFLDSKKVFIDLVNISEGEVKGSRFKVVIGDVTDLSDIPDQSYDLVHSNSVIEHIGSWPGMVAMAKNVYRLAPRHYVQTPYMWFPYEPHYRLPLIHWLPEQIRMRALLIRKTKDVDIAMRIVRERNLLDFRQMSYLFPNSTLKSERVLGITKSILVIK